MRYGRTSCRGLSRRQFLSGAAGIGFLRLCPAGPLLLHNLTLVDGTGAAPVPDAGILIRGDRISSVGKLAAIPVVPDAERVDLDGQTVIPGLIDCHFHIESDAKLALRQLANGVTTFRDPGEWLGSFDALKKRIVGDSLPGPRMSLCGPHIDGENPAYPEDAVVARSPEEARRHAERNIAEGADAIKIYFRLPLDSVKAVVEVCKEKGVVSTAHLEILDAREALRAGVQGIEHITSFGQCLVPRREAEQYRQGVLKDNNYRKAGRYALFAEALFEGPDAKELLELLRLLRPFVDPTLAVFEARAEKLPTGITAEQKTMALDGFKAMKELTQLAHKAGAQIVLGGHTSVPFAGRGEAPWREFELLVESGLTPMEAIKAATLNGARFLRRHKDLGTLESGKYADLLVIDGRPHESAPDIRKLTRVMAAGRWIDRAKYAIY